MMPGGRKERLKAMRAIIRERSIHTQLELMAALEAEKIPCTQGTISRDFSNLGLHKLAGGRYYLPEDLHLRQMLQQFTVTLTEAQNLLVIKTSVGSAQAVAAALDAAQLEQALGSIAGDDTIMVISKDNHDAVELAKQLRFLQNS